MVHSGAWGKLIQEKNLKSKISCQCSCNRLIGLHTRSCTLHSQWEPAAPPHSVSFSLIYCWNTRALLVAQLDDISMWPPFLTQNKRPKMSSIIWMRKRLGVPYPLYPYTECQAFCPVVWIGSPHPPPPQESVAPPPLIEYEGERHTRLRGKGWGGA